MIAHNFLGDYPLKFPPNYAFGSFFVSEIEKNHVISYSMHDSEIISNHYINTLRTIQYVLRFNDFKSEIIRLYLFTSIIWIFYSNKEKQFYVSML